MASNSYLQPFAPARASVACSHFGPRCIYDRVPGLSPPLAPALSHPVPTWTCSRHPGSGSRPGGHLGQCASPTPLWTFRRPQLPLGGPFLTWELTALPQVSSPMEAWARAGCPPSAHAHHAQCGNSDCGPQTPVGSDHTLTPPCAPDPPLCSSRLSCPFHPQLPGPSRGLWGAVPWGLSTRATFSEGSLLTALCLPLAYASRHPFPSILLSLSECHHLPTSLPHP